MERLELEFVPSAQAPGQARRSVDSWLTDVGCSPATVQDVILVVTELVTNSVVHARSLRGLVLTVHDDHVRIEVHDENPSPPQMSTDAGPQGGYGMRIVAAVGHDWGWMPTPSGKMVWTVIHC